MSKQAIARALAAAGMAAAAVAAAGCGEAKEAASFAPANAAVYGEITIDPQGDQEANVDAIAKKFPELGDPERKIAKAFDDSAKEEGNKARWATDIKPWLGETISFFVIQDRDRQPAGAALIASKDDGKAKEALEENARTEKDAKKSFEGVDYWVDSEDETAYGLLDGQVIAGPENGLKAAVTASKKEGLGEAERFGKAWDELPEDRVAAFYADNRRLVEAIGAANPRANADQLRKLTEGGPPTTTAWAKLERDGLIAESKVPAKGAALTAALGRGTPVLERLPQDSWLAFGVPDVGKSLSSAIDQFAGTSGRQIAAQQVRQQLGLDLDRDLLGWMGDLGAFARGTSQAELGGGVVVETSDPAASRRALTGLARAARRQGQGQFRIQQSKPAGADLGFEITAPNLPQPIVAALGDDRVAFAYGEEAAEEALAGDSRLADSPDFKKAKSALGGGFTPSSFVSVAPIVDLASAMGATSDPDFAKAEKYLRRFSYLVAGTKPEGGSLVSRLKVTLK